MKNKDKLMYVSAAVLAAGSVAGVKTTNVKAAEVKQANVNANSKLDLNKQAAARDKTAQGQIKQDTATVQKTQDQLKQDQAAKTQAEAAKTEAQNTLPAKENAVNTAQTKLDNAKKDLTQAQTASKDLHAQYDTTTENAIHTAQEAEKKLDQKVNDLTGQVQTAQNKQTDLLNQRTSAEGDVKTNTETLNNVNEQLNKAQAESTQAQKHFDNVQKDYAPIQNEYNAKKSVAEKAANDLKQNETDLAQSQKQLSDLQTKNNDLAKTVNDTQGQLDNANKEINDVKTDVSQSQAKLNDVTKQSNDVNGKLTSAIAKRDQAKSALDSQSENVQKIVITPEYNKTFHKWYDIHDPSYTRWDNDALESQMTKEMQSVSAKENEINKYQKNAKDMEHKLDVRHLTDAEKLEINKFGINLINQIRTQLGKDPVILNKGSMDFADNVAKLYSRDNFVGKNMHDTDAMIESQKKFGLGFSTNSENLATDPISWVHDMNGLKDFIYRGIASMMFSDYEWDHANLLVFKTDLTSDGRKLPIYMGIGIAKNNDPNVDGNGDSLLMNIEGIVDDQESYQSFLKLANESTGYNHDALIYGANNIKVDYSKFNVKDVIPTDNLDSSQAGQVYAAAQNEVNTLQSQKNNLDGQIKSLNDHLVQSQNKVNDLTKTINDLSTKLANAKTEQGTVQGQIGQVSKHVDELKAAQPALVQARDNTAKALADYEQTHATVLNDYNNAKSQLEQANNKLQSATKAKDEAEKVLNQNKAKLANIDKELDAVKAQLADLTTKLSDAKSSQASAKANLEKAQADYDNYVNTHKDLIDSIAKSDKELADKEEAVRVAQSDYDKASQEYEAAKKEADKLANKVKDLDQSIAKSQETIKSLNNRIASNTQIIEHNKQVHAQATKLAARKAFDAQINKALDKVAYATKPVSQHTVKAATVKPAVSTKNTKHALPQTGVNDKLSLFAALAGLSLSSIGLGSLVSDKKRRRN
ncbi:SEC10/PgrA surface exclusion domain-containing protein [Lactobacillus gasseri]|uniref:SEC10/PgrA surface exclusion domain-containing protein n=1 Tax=Lactobacillus gasseri TaxID=1596 RepID=UPI001F58BD64|nr:SEC10/PgrA surface exclusion domain-containing protein [Lactobacillus gasseri]UNL44155.1 SEC10/PgrA surface exclusion domain-containing protein [Lactobacillus gasseri]